MAREVPREKLAGSSVMTSVSPLKTKVQHVNAWMLRCSNNINPSFFTNMNNGLTMADIVLVLFVVKLNNHIMMVSTTIWYVYCRTNYGNAHGYQFHKQN